jgi:hypothetical protein
MSGANMTDANMAGANMSGANMIGANMSGANMIGANMRYANLSYANLSYANLSSADLSSANMTGANMSGANMTDRYISISRIGSRKGMTTYCFDTDIIWCGCFKGTLEEFKTNVQKVHSDNPQYLQEYLGFISYIESLK